MPVPPGDLSPEQRAVVQGPAEPVLLLGAAGTGKTAVLAARHAWLATDGGVAPEEVLALTATAPAADALRGEVEDALHRGFAELAVHTVHGFCARLLRDEALEAGLDPFVVPVGPADRLALLLEHVDELPLRRHDLRGNPSALLAGVVARIDRLKDAMVTAGEHERWAATLPAGDERAEREREFAALYRAHDRLLAATGALDTGDLVLLAHRLLAGKPHVRARPRRAGRHVLVDDAQDLELAGLRLVLQLAGAADGRLTAAGNDDATVGRLRGAGALGLRTLAEEVPGLRVVRVDAGLPRRRGHPRRRGRRGRPGAGPAGQGGRRGRPGGHRALLALRERARAGPGRGRRGRAAGALGRRPRRRRDRRALREPRGPGARRRPRGARGAVPARRRARLLPARRGQGRLAWLRLLVDPSDAGAVVRALSRAPVELRAIDLARCVQIARRRKLDMVTALVAATESPQLPPEARERVLGFLRLHRSVAAALDTSRPDLFVHRLVDRLGLRRQGLFAAQADVVERLQALARLGDLAASYVRRSPQATARDFARHVAAVAEAGLQDDEPEAEDGGRRGRGGGAAHARRPRDGVPPRPRVRPALRADAGRPPPRPEPIPDALLHEPLPPDTRAVHVDEMRRLLHLAMTRADEGLVLAYAAHATRAPCSPRPPSPRRRGRRSGPSGTTARRSSSAPTRPSTPPSSRCATTSCARCRGSARGWASCGSTPTSTSPTGSCATSSS